MEKVRLNYGLRSRHDLGRGTAQSCSPRGDQSGLNVLGGSVPIGEPDLAGTRSPQWPQGQAGKRRSPSKVRCRRLPAGSPATSVPRPDPKTTKTHHNRGELPHRGFDARKTNRSIRTIARIPYPAVGVVFWSCIWTGASEHYAVAGGFG